MTIETQCEEWLSAYTERLLTKCGSVTADKVFRARHLIKSGTRSLWSVLYDMSCLDNSEKITCYRAERVSSRGEVRVPLTIDGYLDVPALIADCIGAVNNRRGLESYKSYSRFLNIPVEKYSRSEPEIIRRELVTNSVTLIVETDGELRDVVVPLRFVYSAPSIRRLTENRGGCNIRAAAVRGITLDVSSISKSAARKLANYEGGKRLSPYVSNKTDGEIVSSV